MFSPLVFGVDREPGLYVRPRIFRGELMWCEWDSARDRRLSDIPSGPHAPFPMERCDFYDGEDECGQPVEDPWVTEWLPGNCAFHGQVELLRAVREMEREEAMRV